MLLISCIPLTVVMELDHSTFLNPIALKVWFYHYSSKYVYMIVNQTRYVHKCTYVYNCNLCTYLYALRMYMR